MQILAIAPARVITRADELGWFQGGDDGCASGWWPVSGSKYRSVGPVEVARHLVRADYQDVAVRAVVGESGQLGSLGGG